MDTTGSSEGIGRAPHPGALLRLHVLPALSLSVSQASRDLGVTRQTLHRILSGQASVTPAMAMRLERFCGVPGRVWLSRQIDHDLDRPALGEIELAACKAHTLPPETLILIGGADA